MDVVITRANPADAEVILALQKLAYEREAQLYDDWSLPPLVQSLAELRAEFAHKVVLKAEVDRRLVGSVRASVADGTCAIGRLIVHPDYQRRGIGTRLLTTMEAAFPEAERYELFTGGRSMDNIRLYTALGYRMARAEALSPKVTLVYLSKPQSAR
jgi:predicted N-acetyltransferase YhbS